MYFHQTFYHLILSTSAKTFLFSVNFLFFYNTLKFEKFLPSWFMAAYWRRLGIAVNDVILILNLSKTKIKTMKDEYLNNFVECCQLPNWKAIRQCFLVQANHSNMVWRHLRLFPVSLVTRPWTKTEGTLGNFRVLWKKQWTKIKNVFAEMLKIVW